MISRGIQPQIEGIDHRLQQPDVLAPPPKQPPQSYREAANCERDVDRELDLHKDLTVRTVPPSTQARVVTYRQ
jgi:hypothetical protein